MAEIGVAEKLGSHLVNPSTNGAAETVVVALGKEYHFSFPEQRFKGQFEQWLVRNAIRSITDCESFAADEPDENQKLIYLREADKQRQMFSSNRSAGLYNWMGAVSRKAISDVPGSVYLSFLFLRRCHPDITEQEVYAAYMDRMEDFNAAVRWALGKEMALLGGAAPKRGKALTETEVYAELVHSGVSLAEIAGMTDTQIRELYFRPRDEYGRLKRAGRLRQNEVECPKTKHWKKSASFSAMFKQVWSDRGLTPEQVEQRWRDYVNKPNNKSLRKRIERNDRVRARMEANGFNRRRPEVHDKG